MFKSVELTYQNDKFVLNGETFSSLDDIYNDMQLNYPKFFKMDNLAKLGLLGIEKLLVLNPELVTAEKDQVAQIYWNTNSSAESDAKHSGAYKTKSASPAVFVYTLPNIVMGEIAIKHKWTGENIFFVDNELSPELMDAYLSSLLGKERTTYVIFGQIEFFQSSIKLELNIYK